MTKYNLKLKKGTDFNFPFRIRKTETGELVDLTGYAGSMRIKDKYNGVILASAIVNIDTDTNIVSFSINHTDTAQLPEGIALYDIDLTNASGEVRNVFYGEIEILQNTNI